MWGKLQRLDEVVKKRREICNSCEHKKILMGAKICGKCGCSIWAKSAIPSFKCPLDKWDKE